MYVISYTETRFIRDTIKDISEQDDVYTTVDDCLEILEGILEHGKRVELEEASE